MKKIKLAFTSMVFMMLAIVLISGSCQKNPPIPDPPKPTNTPTVKTVAVTLVSADETGAVIKASGEIINTGGTAITYRGFYLSKKKSPSIDDTVIVASSSFSRTINLPVNGTYYLVAFATNDKGTSTGAVKMVKTDWLIKDYDGNVYHTVKVGSQWWLKEDLKVTHYNDGAPIPNVIDDNQWSYLTTGAYCNYNNDTSLVKTYGRLYNYFAVETGKLGIRGWHVPTEDEILSLYMALGNDPHNGGKLKEVGTEHWKSPNAGATNSTGLTIIPGGNRIGKFDNPGKFVKIHLEMGWWIKEKFDPNRGEVSGVEYNSDIFYVLVTFPKNYGLNVRLIKNQ